WVPPERARALARICALNALAAVDSLVGIDAIARVVKVVGFVASAPGFHGQPGVVNRACELFGEVFGEAGAHARSAGGVAELPLNAPVEVELIVEVAWTVQCPAYGLLRPVTDTASVLLCNNPGPLTLEGTNTWVLRGAGSDEMV